MKKLYTFKNGAVFWPTLYMRQKKTFMYTITVRKCSDVSLGLDIGVASQGCTGCMCTPRAEKQFFSGSNLHGKVVSAPLDRECAHPRGRARVHFLGNWGDVDGSFSVCFEGDD